MWNKSTNLFETYLFACMLDKENEKKKEASVSYITKIS